MGIRFWEGNRLATTRDARIFLCVCVCVCVCVLRQILAKRQPLSESPDHLLPGGIFHRNWQWLPGPPLNSRVMLQPLHWTLSTLLPKSSPGLHECLFPACDMDLHSSFSDNVRGSDLCGVSQSGSSTDVLFFYPSIHHSFIHRHLLNFYCVSVAVVGPRDR